MSVEQLAVVKAIGDSNVIVDSVAGSGKTSTIIRIVEAYPNNTILVITYNTRLRHDTKYRTRHLENVDVHTYHSFCVNLYGNTDCSTDSGVLRLLRKKVPVVSSVNKSGSGSDDVDRLEEVPIIYDMIILDEAQDINNLYYRLALKVMNDYCTPNTIIGMFGDQYQNIYAYNGTDARYLLLADRLFTNNYQWTKLTLSVSFRVPPSIAAFINHCFLGYDRIGTPVLPIGAKVRPSGVRYLICNPFKAPYDEVCMYLLKGYKPADIFILTPSLKSPMVKHLANKLTKHRINIHIPSSEGDRISDDVIRDKIVFCSFHQSKGLERKVTVILNFDKSYTTYYNTSEIPVSTVLSIPVSAGRTHPYNEMYVALTRCTDWLSVIHDSNCDYLYRPDPAYCTVINLKPMKVKAGVVVAAVSTKKVLSVTDILKHIDAKDTATILANFTITKLQEKQSIINIPKHTTSYLNGGVVKESVSDITGVAIVAYFEYKRTGKITINELIISNKKAFKKLLDGNGGSVDTKKSMFIKRDGAATNTDVIDFFMRGGGVHIDGTGGIDLNAPSVLLEIANIWNCINSSLNFKFYQVVKYDWLSNNVLEAVYKRLDTQLSINSDFEVFHKVELDKYILGGYIDCVDYGKNIVWEFKCVTELNDIHYLQLALYMCIREAVNGKSGMSYCLINLLTSEMHRIEINAGLSVLDILNHVYSLKYENKNREDDEFLKSV